VEIKGGLDMDYIDHLAIPKDSPEDEVDWIL